MSDCVMYAAYLCLISPVFSLFAPFDPIQILEHHPLQPEHKLTPEIALKDPVDLYLLYSKAQRGKEVKPPSRLKPTQKAALRVTSILEGESCFAPYHFLLLPTLPLPTLPLPHHLPTLPYHLLSLPPYAFLLLPP